MATLPILSFAQEITTGTNIVVQSTPESSIIQDILIKFETSWPWYLTRASGLIAFVLFLLLMLSGIGFITGHTFKFLEPITGWMTHKALGISLGVALFLHIGALYFDHFVHFDLASLLIPFVSDYKPVDFFGIQFGSLYVAIGILAFYVIIVTVITSLIWINTKQKSWKFVHLLNYIAAALIFFHSLYLGTDLSGGVLRVIFIALGAVILAASIIRLWRAKNT